MYCVLVHYSVFFRISCPWAVVILLWRLEYIVCWCIILSISGYLCPWAVVFLLWRLEYIVCWCIILSILGYLCPWAVVFLLWRH